MLCSGELSICAVSRAAGILTRENHRKLLRELRGRMFREIDEIVSRHSPVSRTRERVKPVSVLCAPPGSVSGGAEVRSLLDDDSAERPDFDRQHGGRELTAGVPSRASGTDTPRAEPPVNCSTDTAARPNDFSNPNSDATQAGRSCLPSSASRQQYKVEFSADRDFIARMEDVRSLLSNRFPRGASMEKLFSILMDEFLDRHSPARRAARREKRVERRTNGRGQGTGPAAGSATGEFSTKVKRGSGSEEPAGRPQAERMSMRTTARSSEVSPEQDGIRSRHIPARIRDEVFVRDGGRCTWVAPDGTRCGSTHRLQIDHIRPFARGGAHRLENLRLLCAAHNRLSAEMEFGPRGAGRSGARRGAP